MTDFTSKEIWEVLSLAKKLKNRLQESGKNSPVLENKTLVSIFAKPSLRTRLSFEIGMHQLGGHVVSFDGHEVGLDTRESTADVGKVISRMADVLMVRTCDHQILEELSQCASIPVINGLSDVEHPCQILADLLTIWEIKGKLAGLTIGYIGDAENNVTNSLYLGAALLGMNFNYAAPKGYYINEEIFKKGIQLAKKSGAKIVETNDPKAAVKDVDVVITDTWVSMGDKVKKRLEDLRPYQVNESLMKLAKKNAIFMHCLPAQRGNEVTSDVIDGPQSVVFQEAENRLHVQKALLIYLCLMLYTLKTCRIKL